MANTRTCTHTHTHIVARDTVGGWSLGQGSDAILTHVGVSHPPIKLMGYEHQEDEVGLVWCGVVWCSGVE